MAEQAVVAEQAVMAEQAVVAHLAVEGHRDDALGVTDVGRPVQDVRVKLRTRDVASP